MDRFDDRSDDELLVDARSEPEAFAAFYRRFEAPVLLFFLRRVQSAELAADLAAETFAQALASRGRYRPERGSVVIGLALTGVFPRASAFSQILALSPFRHRGWQVWMILY